MVQNILELKQFFIVCSQNSKGEKVRLGHLISWEALSKFGMFPSVILKMGIKIRACLSPRVAVRIKRNEGCEKRCLSHQASSTCQ